MVDALVNTGHDGEDHRNLFGAIDTLRIPLAYLAELFTAGDPGPVRGVLRTLSAMRAHMRRVNLGEEPDLDIPASVGMTVDEIERLYRLLAIARYDERYVIPAAHAEMAGVLEETPGCSVEEYEHGARGGHLGEASVTPVTIENFDLARRRARADRYAELGEPVTFRRRQS
jgi:nitrate reductase beta subunit